MSNLLPLVSIGIPTYNRYNYLVRAIDIVLNQSYKNIEIIISDNCSSDSRIDELCLNLSSKDKRIHYYKQISNIGILKNTEFVFKKSSGDFFIWFSDDDWRDKDAINILVSKLVNSGKDYIFSDYLEVGENNEMLEKYPSSHLRYFKNFTFRSKILRQVCYYMQDSKFGKQNIFYSLFKRALLEKINFHKISNNYTFLQMDNIIAYSAISHDIILIEDKCLLKLTCYNKKEYILNENNSFFNKLSNFYKFYFMESFYLIRNNNTILITKILFIILLPIKLLLVTYNRLIK
jgi:glycosyltransferase involved in cell wall biosynthesis